MTLRVQGIAQVVVKLGNIRAQRDRTVDILNGHFLVASFVADDTEKMQGIGVIRIDAKNLSVEPFSLLPLSGLMALDGAHKYFRNGRHGHSSLR